VRTLTVPLVAASLAVAFAASAPAQTYAPIYGIRHTAPPEIWSIDLQTGHATFVTNHLAKTKVACARHPRTGQVWTFSNVTPNKISVWDPTTDAETTINAGPNVQFHRVGFDADCKLYGVPLNSNALYLIDTTTGALTNLGGMGGVGTNGDGGDLAFPPGVIDHFTYFAGQKYYDVQVSNRAGTLINGAIPFKVTGAGYTADGRLWVTSDTDLYECDPATGNMTLVGSFGMKQILDITEDLSPMYFGVDDLAPSPNDVVNAFVRQGGANAPLLLAAVAVDGVPTFVDLGLTTFDANGEFAISEIIDPGLSGSSITILAFGIAVNGDLLVTNEQTITFL
jgi:hypothetical protein